MSASARGNYNTAMKSGREISRRSPTTPLSDAEVEQLSHALKRLAEERLAVSADLLRDDRTGDDVRSYRHYGHTLDAIPSALDRLGADRERVVVALLSRFEQAVRDVHDQVKNRTKDTPRDPVIAQRYFDVGYLLCAAKPKTEASATQIANFLFCEEDEVHTKASEMLEGAPYFPVVVDRLFENVATYGIRQWPNRQSRALASFASVPEVRKRLLNSFHAEQKCMRNVAIMAFSFLKENAGADAEAEIFAIAENDADELQSSALGALRKITEHSSRLRQLALRLVRSDKFWVRGIAIMCLEPFQDREVIDALLSALVDEGGPDFDNAGAAAKLLRKMPLTAEQALAPLTDTLNILLEREDKRYEEQVGFRHGVVTYQSPETLLAVARVLANLGTAARPAVALLEICINRPYVAGASDFQEWHRVLTSINQGAIDDKATN
jgi:hypothetical protein